MGAVALNVRNRVVEDKQATAAAGLVQQLLKVDTAQVPGVVQAIGDYRRWIDPELRRAVAAASADPRVKLHASLALLPVDPTQVPYLETRLLDALPGELLVLRDALQPHRLDLTPKLWTALESAGPGDARLLTSAGALALYDPEGPRWADLSSKVAGALVTVNSLVLGPMARSAAAGAWQADSPAGGDFPGPGPLRDRPLAGNRHPGRLRQRRARLAGRAAHGCRPEGLRDPLPRRRAAGGEGGPRVPGRAGPTPADRRQQTGLGTAPGRAGRASGAGRDRLGSPGPCR